MKRTLENAAMQVTLPREVLSQALVHKGGTAIDQIAAVAPPANRSCTSAFIQRAKEASDVQVR
ncbi:MAG TPA: hypothetical protein VHZ07_28350 [Bryobacteraceae bacterium]|nr:hypothetical protein [Bryobacteraceae bacterium]